MSSADELSCRVSKRDRLDRIVGDLDPTISRSRAAALIRDGRVRVDHEVVVKPAAKVAGGALVVLSVPEPEPSQAEPQDLDIDVVFEDADLAVINKAAGMVVHPAPGHADGTLVNALLHHLDELSGIGGVQRPGIVHRLDRGTSGLMVVAKNDAAHQHLSAQFADHTAGRRYLALCIGSPLANEGTVRSNLARHPKDRMRYASTDDGHGKHAVTHWKCRARAGRISLVECWLETGRTHQVRVHCAEQGWPLVGDAMYGKKRQAQLPATLRGMVDPNRPLLHAWQLRLTHPSGTPLVFEAPPPEDFLAALRAVEIEVAALPEAIRHRC